MTDQPQQTDSSNSLSNVSGGVNANAERIDIGGDAVGRDKIENTVTHVGNSRTAIFAIAALVIVALAAMIVLVLVRSPGGSSPAETIAAISTPALVSLPASSEILFSSPTTNAASLNPILEWEAGGSALSRYSIYTDVVKLVADSHTWPFFPSIRYKLPLKGDFDVQARLVFTSPFLTVPTAQMAGIIVRPVGARLVMGDSKFPENWIVIAKSITDAGHMVGCRGAWADYASDVVYVKVKRTGDSWYCGYSDNNENWKWLGPRVDTSLSNDEPMEMALFAYSETDDKLSIEFSNWIIAH